MRLQAAPATTIPPVHHTTDAELLRTIDSYFPDVTGWLKELRDRFAEKVDGTDEAVSGTAQCPSCGTRVNISEVTL
jgi:hypothetical protein